MNAKEFKKLSIACNRAQNMFEQYETQLDKIAEQQMALRKKAYFEIFPHNKKPYEFNYDYITIDRELYIGCTRWERCGYGSDETLHSERLDERMFSEEGRQQLKEKYLNEYKKKKARNEANAIKQREAELQKKKEQLEKLKQEIEEYKK